VEPTPFGDALYGTNLLLPILSIIAVVIVVVAVSLAVYFRKLKKNKEKDYESKVFAQSSSTVRLGCLSRGLLLE
jgi:uncharacterized membrane protein